MRKLRQSAAAIRERTGVDEHDVAIVLGSGWAPAVDELGDPVAVVPMAELTGFTPPTAAGHGGQMLSLRRRRPPRAGVPRQDPRLRRTRAPARRSSRAGRMRGRCAHGRADQRRGQPARGLRRGTTGADQRPPQSDRPVTAGRRPFRRHGRRVLSAPARRCPRDRPDAGRRRLRRTERTAVRDARRDPDAAHAGRGSRRHVDRARDRRGARRGCPGAWGVAGDQSSQRE